MSVPVVGIIGAGNRAHNTQRVAADKGLVKIKYLWDTSDHNREWLKKQHGWDAILCDSPEEIYKDPEVDAILVITPQNHRREYVEEIVKTGKCLYLDKPVASTPEDVMAIWRMLNDSGIKTMTGFTLRYMPGFYTVKEIIESGELGEITQIRACQHIPAAGGMNFVRKWSRLYENSGGYVNEMGVHDIDGVIWLSGSFPKSVYANQQKSLYQPRADRPEHCMDCDDAECVFRCAPSDTVKGPCLPIGGLNLSPEQQENPKKFDLDLCCYNSGHDLYDRGAFTIEMENGVLGTFEFNTCSARMGREYEIFGSKGQIWGNLPTNKFFMQKCFEQEAKEYDERNKALPEAGGEPVFGDGALFEEMTQVFLGDRKPKATVKNAVIACMAIFAGERSTKEGCAVTLKDMIDDDLWDSLRG